MNIGSAACDSETTMDGLKKAIVPGILILIVGGLVFVALNGSAQAGAIDHFPLVNTPAQFQQLVLDEPGVVLVDIYTPTCTFCRKLAPELAKLAKRFDGRIKFVRLNADEGREVAGRHRIQGVPTMVVYANGVEVDRLVGYMPADAIAVRLDQALAAQ